LISHSVSLAATWDNHAIEDICEVLISEARSKEVDILLGPAGEEDRERPAHTNNGS
jgi:beta-glucosidase-like glycosyl hydrolase